MHCPLRQISIAAHATPWEFPVLGGSIVLQDPEPPQFVSDVLGSMQLELQLISCTLSLGLTGHTQLPVLQLDPAIPVRGSVQF
jgi:hypothetical protein